MKGSERVKGQWMIQGYITLSKQSTIEGEVERCQEVMSLASMNSIQIQGKVETIG